MKKLCIALAFLANTPLFAQVEATMPTMSGVAQNTLYNPAFKPRYNFTFGLPAVFLQSASNSLNWNKTGNLEDGNWTIDLPKIAANLREKNYFSMNAQVSPFFLSVKAGARLHLSFDVTLKMYTRFMAPKGLIALATKGNYPYMGQTLELSPKIEQLTYMDIGAGGAYSVTHKLTVGGRIKLLRGILNFTTKDSRMELTTQADQINVTASADLRSSGLADLDDLKNNKISAGELVGRLLRNSGKNTGLGLDMGATYQVNDRLMVGASIIDLGFINWANNTKSHTVSPSLTFNGIDVQKAVDNWKKYADSLKTAIDDKTKVKSENSGSYVTGIPVKMYLSAVYKLKHDIDVSGLLFFEKYRERFFPGFSVAAHKEFGKRLGASLSYTATQNSYNNLGLGLSVNLAHTQLYIVGDNLAYGWMIPNSFLRNVQYFNFRVGLNVVMDRRKSEEKSVQPFGK